MALGVAYAAFNKEVQRRKTKPAPFLAGLVAVEAYHRRHQIRRFVDAVTTMHNADEWHA